MKLTPNDSLYQIRLLKHLIKEIKMYSKKNIPIEFNAKLINTGIVEGAEDSINGWKQYYVLGGKSIEIRIDFPNKLTINQAIAKNKNSKR